MAQLTIEISEELAQQLAPYQHQLPEIFTRLFNTSITNQNSDNLDLSNNLAFTELPTYLEIIDFLVNRPTSEQIANFKISERSQIRLRELLQKNRDANLIPSERAELNLYEQLDTLMAMMKIRAYTDIQSRNHNNSHPA